MSELRIIAGPIADESDLVNALRVRVDEVNVSRSELDIANRLPTGYTSKRLAVPQIKYFGREAFWNIAESLGLVVLLVEDPAATKRYAARMKRRSTPQAVSGSAHWRSARAEALLKARIQEITSKGGIARAAKLTKKQRACSARKAAKVRWRHWRKLRKAARAQDSSARV